MPAPAPTAYTHGYSYSAFEAAAPGDPKPGGALDADFYAVSTSLNSVILALADVRAASGGIAAAKVNPSSLAGATLALMGGWTLRGNWTVDAVYAVSDLVTAPVGGGTYACVTAHTAAVFNTELAAGKWVCLTPVGYGVTAAIEPALVGDVGKLLTVTGADTYAWTASPFTPVGFRNRIINGDFQINQRGFVSGASLAAGAYGHDRWKGGASGATYTFSSVLPSNSLTISAGTLMQVIEGGHMEGGSFWLSWSGSAQMRVNGGSWSASPLLTAGLTAGVDVTVEVGTGTFANPQFETNGVTLFERRPPALEMILCERYFRRVTAHLAGYSSGAAQVHSNALYWPAMRAIPTVTVAVAGTALNATSAVLGGATLSGARFDVTATAAGAVNTIDKVFNLAAEL